VASIVGERLWAGRLVAELAESRDAVGLGPDADAASADDVLAGEIDIDEFLKK